MTYRYQYDRNLIGFSRENRRNQTDAERLLWQHIKSKQIGNNKFRRQYPINNYILDFYCVEKKLAIELDGGQHKARKSYDKKRTGDLEKFGIQVIRFWDNEVLQYIEEVLEEIAKNLANLTLPSPKRRGR